ncbi:FecR family protein [Siccirubricoccus phaeus]|uniref:FecR family protein n=1 Tax=Siccirubricoccus phaeus TaxID=2595053 RepID=UPI00165AA7CF|nr:FecR family protein [Siccirubricoccus phaeus]
MAKARQHDDDGLRQEAHRWVVRLTSGAATDADAWQLSAWRSRSPAHEAAYRDAVRLWHQLAPVANEQGLVDREQHRRRAVRRRRALVGGTALAASGAGLILLGKRLDLVPSPGVLAAWHRTSAGEQRRLALEDGSVVEMNTRTSLSVRYGGVERRIDLADGEAIFTVRPDPARPFVVTAAGGETRALGTVFDVRRDGDEVSITCLEGKVRVQRIGSVDLEAAQQVAYSPAGLARSPRSVDPELATGWRRGVLVFRDEPIRRVLGELNRYRPGRIILATAEPAGRHVSGVFHLSRLDEALTQVERIGGLRRIALPGGILLLR